MFAAHTYENEIPLDDVCAALANLAAILKELGDSEAALAAYLRAVDVLVRVEPKPAQLLRRRY